VLCGTVAAARLTWRLSQKRSLTYTVIALCLVCPLVLDLVAASKVPITALAGATQLNDAYGP
jgi:hypothetical protein